MFAVTTKYKDQGASNQSFEYLVQAVEAYHRECQRIRAEDGSNVTVLLIQVLDTTKF